MQCPFYRYGICTAVDDYALAKAVVDPFRCTHGWKTCKIYLKNKDKLKKKPNKANLTAYITYTHDKPEKKNNSELEKAIRELLAERGKITHYIKGNA